MQPGTIHAVDGHRQRFHQAGVLERQAAGQPVEERAGTATSSANPPSRANPMPAVSAIAQRYEAPLRQSSQTPQGILGSMTAGSPATPAGHAVTDGLDHTGELVSRGSHR